MAVDTDNGKLVRNRIRCNACGEVIESKYRHDFRSCGCGACFVDGGLAYLRRGFGSAGFVEMSEYERET